MCNACVLSSGLSARVQVPNNCKRYRAPASAVGCTGSTARSHMRAGQGVYVNPEPFTPCIPALGWDDPAGSLCIHPKWVTTSRQGGGGQGVGKGDGGGGYKHQLRPSTWMSRKERHGSRIQG